MKIAFVFDVDDTLYDQMQPFRKALGRTFPSLKPQTGSSVWVQELFKSSRRYSDEVFEKTRTGEMTMDEMYIYRLKNPLRDVGIEIADEQALEFQRNYQDELDHLELAESIREILEKSACELGILTNGPAEHQWKKIDALGLTEWIRREHIIVSGDVGTTKPGRAIFDLAAACFPECERYMIGDSIETDIVGGANAGWHTIWFNHRFKENHAGVEPEYEVHSAEELKNLLDRIRRTNN